MSWAKLGKLSALGSSCMCGKTKLQIPFLVVRRDLRIRMKKLPSLEMVSRVSVGPAPLLCLPLRRREDFVCFVTPLTL